MAVMYESIILCVIGIVIYTSAAYNINTNICLETAVQFINDPYRCRFRSYYADADLKDGATCTNKCNVRIYHLNNQYTYYVRQVHVTIGTEQTFTQSICRSSHTAYKPMDMYIKCLSWNKDKYTVMDTTACPLNSAQCEKIDKYCICHCYPGYSIINESCLKENVALGHSCSYHWQCTGTEFASVCKNHRCECQSGYRLISSNCYQEKVTVGNSCLFQWQCTGTKFASVCNQYGLCECQPGCILNDKNCYLAKNVTVGNSCIYDSQCTGTQLASVCNDHRCECQSPYMLIGNNCYTGNVSVGGFCHHSKQCAGSEHSTTCKNSRCTCSNKYILIDFKCEQGNITINQSCLHNRQCTGTEFADLCSFGVCTCQAGYILIDNNCYPDHVPVGGFCTLDKQCTGSNNSEACRDGKCRCSDEHVLLDLECVQDNMIGKILGTLFGGMLIGVILTAVVALLVFQNMRTKLKKREEPSVSFANDAIYSSAIVVEREDITCSQANEKKRKVVNVLPKGAVYSFVNRKPRIEQPTTEGVYNHLREEEKHDKEDDDNYDHACAASYLGTEPSVYSNMP